FAHVLVREAAYAATPKEARAELHARFAAWLERAPHDEPEREELLGYHLEQAYRYRAELRRIDDEALALRRRAGTLLASAGRRAIGRDDAPAAVKLLQRAVPLLDDDAAAGVLPDLGAALASTGALVQANEVLATAIERA